MNLHKETKGAVKGINKDKIAVLFVCIKCHMISNIWNIIEQNKLMN